LQKIHKTESNCHSLLKETIVALNNNVVGLMLLAVQRGNLELCIRTAVEGIDHIELSKKK